MDPVIIHSFLGGRHGNAVSYEETKIFATCSHFYAKKNTGLKIVLYTDKIGYDLLKDIPYDEIIFFDEEIVEKLPKSVWSAGKILAISMEKRPFVHIDFDFFILKPGFLDIIKDAPFFAYHNEPWSAYLGKKSTFNKKGVQVILKVLNKNLNINHKKNFISVNFSMFGSCILKNISIINNMAQKMIDCIIEHKKFLDSKYLLDTFAPYFGTINGVMIPLIIEQVLLVDMIKQELKFYKTCIRIKDPIYSYPEGLKIGLLHIWGAKHKKVNMEKMKGLYNFINNKSSGTIKSVNNINVKSNKIFETIRK